MKKFWIHAGTLIDGTGAEPKKNQAICVENGRVAAIEDFHGKNEDVYKRQVSRHALKMPASCGSAIRL